MQCDPLIVKHSYKIMIKKIEEQVYPKEVVNFGILQKFKKY